MYVLVTTKYRGVFAGDLITEDGTTAVLRDARSAIHFGTTRGFLELAQTGPTPRSKIGGVAPQIKLHGVTSIAHISARAEVEWKSR